MEKIYASVKNLEKYLQNEIKISEELMIENAASALENIILSKLENYANDLSTNNSNKGASVLILCGSGNNGADGYALSRHLADICEVCVVEDAKSAHCKYEQKTAKACGIIFLSKQMAAKKISSFKIVVDCIYGTGFHGNLESSLAQFIFKINSAPCLRIACDIPSGIDSNGNILSIYKKNLLAFNADTTVAMGALKLAYYSDVAKDFCGKIIRKNIGVSQNILECKKESALLLSPCDMILPIRTKQAVNKGNFGHAAIILGEKPGAAILAGTAAFNFGVGFVTLIEKNHLEEKSQNVQAGKNHSFKIPPELMIGETFRKNTRALVVGPGLGQDNYDFISHIQNWIIKQKTCGLVLDADMFYYDKIALLLKEFSTKCPNARIVLTPHPKEFASLLTLCSLGSYSIQEITSNRFELVKKFNATFPNVVLILKGANSLIAGKNIYVCTEGHPCLAKAGSGDVLAGLVCALLAQEYSAENAAITATLAHGIASQKFSNGFGMTPLKLIESCASLQ